MCILKSFGSISVASMKWCFEILFKIFSTSFISRIWLTVLFHLNGSQNVIDIKLTFFCDDRKCFVSVRHAWDKKSKKKKKQLLLGSVFRPGLSLIALYFIYFFFQHFDEMYKDRHTQKGGELHTDSELCTVCWEYCIRNSVGIFL